MAWCWCAPAYRPKRLIPFRTDKPFRKIRIRFVDTKEKLEFLGDGQQYAAFGIHPDTQQPYTWRGGEPGTVPRSALPEIDEASARALINAAAELLVTRFGYRRVDTNKKYLMTCCASPGHDPVVAQDCTTALNQMDPVDWQGNRERWLELLIACKAVGISLQAFMAWSIRDEIYAGEEDEIARQWRHVAPRHGGAFWAALKAREIKIERHRHEVLLPSLSKVPSLAYVLDRFSRIANPSEQDLFSHACWLADVAQRHGLRAPRQYMRLIETRAAESSLWELLGADGCRRSIANGFAHVELKYGAQGVQR